MLLWSDLSSDTINHNDPSYVERTGAVLRGGPSERVEDVAAPESDQGAASQWDISLEVALTLEPLLSRQVSITLPV